MSDHTPDAPVPGPTGQPAPPSPQPGQGQYPASQQGAHPQPGAYPPPAQGAYPPPAQGAQPPAYGAPAYGAPYGTAPAYGYGAQPKTNALAIVSLIASIVGFIGILPIIGSIGGVITGHISLNQLKTNGENGRGMALAGTIVGYVGLAFWIIGGIALFSFIAWAASQSSQYGY
ncbi:DUF4190 domain-containing protein [Microbacterium sp. HD4P20]|uniref:DUF4190 domain-containing protein n=1 Tax=Microbacterium sp. HD4P20 TaxID=2864874 RepID=UPI0020A44A87|nr:DUF4190 domain-containing protein [Microbacterium sp. HD4P20]MCP2637034.1 DUF4190 domain-containing protein [Microbacterium sp. HD4P20]